MTHAPPVPEGNQSPYPIAEPPLAKTPPPERRDYAHRHQGSGAGLIAGLAAGAVAALGALGLIAYLLQRKGDRGPATLEGTGRVVRKPARKAKVAARKTPSSKRETAKQRAATAKQRQSSKSARSGDDPSIRGPRDASLIAMGEDHEVAYWTKKFGVDKAALQAAVDAVGNGTRAVAAHLAKP